MVFESGSDTIFTKVAEEKPIRTLILLAVPYNST